jgi:diguanylate cyclase (GGDEF)-like protein
MSSESRPHQAGPAEFSQDQHRFWTISAKFPAEAEAAFQREMGELRVQRARKTGVVALVLYGGFALGDRVMVPDVFWQALAIRFLVVMPLMLLAMVAIERMPHRPWRELLLVASVIAVGASLPLIAGLSRHPNALHYQAGITLVVLFGNIVLGLRLRDALITTLLLSVVYVASLSMQTGMPPEVRFNSLLFYLSAVIISLIANYRMDRDQRRAYLARERELERNAELSELVEMLARQSAEDGLTRIANRREFDRRLALEWGRARREGQSLALIMVDVDRFKLFNDQYGHLAGDSCLQRIAMALQAVPQRSADLVARFGGEEFAVLLPATSMADAQRIAERMRRAVIELQMPHPGSGVAPYVSASFGVAALVPRMQDQPAALVAAADAALYRAKEEGRNRVVPHAEAVVSARPDLAGHA